MISDCLKESIAVSTLIVIKNSVSMKETDTLKAFGLTLTEAQYVVREAVNTIKTGGKITQSACEKLNKIFIC